MLFHLTFTYTYKQQLEISLHKREVLSIYRKKKGVNNYGKLDFFIFIVETVKRERKITFTSFKAILIRVLFVCGLFVC